MNWQSALCENITTTEELLDYFPMDEEEQAKMSQILRRYPASIPEYYLSLVDWNDPEDPIRKMCVPSLAETDTSGSFDTSGEMDNTVIEGLQHKYRETAMLLSTSQCAMYCRHCFRKRLVGLSDEEVARHFGAMRAYIQRHTEISNVLVSGGDALLNSNSRLRRLLAMLADIGHLDALRIASRVPVVFPQRISGDQELLAILEEFNARKQLIFVTQYNHARELTPESLAAIRAIQKIGIPVKNQTVLLKGVNDTGESLGTLLRKLTGAGISPYYVFQCRPVTGVKNQFQVPLRQGAEIVEEAKSGQNGLGKSFHYCMSHVTGKIEILGSMEPGKLLLKYHEAKERENLGRIFAQRVSEEQAWLPEELILE